MPIILTKNIEETSLLGIWKVTETYEQLHEKAVKLNNKAAFQFPANSHKRKTELVCSRLLLQNLLGDTQGNLDIKYDTFGKPYIADSFYKISISHSQNYVVAIASKNKLVGIDIERISSRIGKIAHKFINGKEAATIKEKSKIEQMHIIWGAKEAAYKLYGKKELDFKENILINPFLYENSGKLYVQVVKDNYKKEIQVFYESFNNYMLVYAISEM